MKNRITIRMGAAHYDVKVRSPSGDVLTFDLSKMDKEETHTFRRMLVRAFKESNEG